jgi:hypothetical protein
MPNDVSERYAQALGHFRQARAQFFASGARSTAERGVSGAIDGADPEHVLNRSADLRTVLEDAVTGDDSDIADLASMKLMAAAAYDISLAGELLAQTGHTTGATERSVRMDPAVKDDLDEVLGWPLDADGLAKIARSERGVLPSDFAGACRELSKEIRLCLKEIPSQSMELAGKAISGVVAFAPPGSGWESVLGGEFSHKMPGAVSWAAKAALEGVQKLWSAVGKDHKSTVLDGLKEWIDKVKEKAGEAAVEWLFDVSALEESLLSKVDQTPPGTAPTQINGGTRRLGQLRERYAKTKSVLSGILTVTNVAKKPLALAVPWGPVVAYGVYTLVCGYAIYSGGDYLDSPRFRVIDVVRGVGITVTQATV